MQYHSSKISDAVLLSGAGVPPSQTLSEGKRVSWNRGYAARVGSTLWW
jgi:hypothetical protein